MKHQMLEKKTAHEGNNKKAKIKSKKTPVEVYCRLRPLKNSNDKQVIHTTSDENLQIVIDGQVKQIYKFNCIFQADSQQTDVFNKIGLPLVQKLFKGENGLLFTYGVTSAGKTYTITGSPNTPGLLPRVLDVAFNTLMKTDLQSRKYAFKPDGHNGFETESTPDAILKLQNENRDVFSRQLRKQSNPILSEWVSREREESFVKDVNHDFHYSIFVSYVENYNKYIYDLLDDNQFDQLFPLRQGQKNGQNLLMSKGLRESSQKQVYVQNVVEIETRSAQEAFELFMKGNMRRRMGSTSLNAESSRSHSIFTIRLVRAPLNLNGTELIPNSSQITVSQLSIVDLAGCERTQRTGATGNRLKEASSINNSLMTLRYCFEALRENQKITSPAQKKLVPYRDSRLTHLFKSFFEGTGQVKMIICLNPGAEDIEETHNVLKFGELSQEIMTTKGNDPLNKFNFANGFKMSDFALFSLTHWPEKFLVEADDEKIIPIWQSVERQRAQEKIRFQEMLHGKMGHIRQIIVRKDQETALTKQENSQLKTDLSGREKCLRECENQVLLLQKENEKMQRNISLLHGENNSLQEEISRTQYKSLQTEESYTRLKENMEEYFERHRMEMSKTFAKMMKDKEEKLRQLECLNKRKLEVAAKVLLEDNEDLLKNMKLMSPQKLISLAEKSQQSVNVQTEVKKLNSHRVVPTEEFLEEVPTLLSPTSGHPVVNPKFATTLVEGKEKWIDHRPPGTIELGTVMQPVLKNCKSVTELKAKDFTGRTSSKYVITHHEGTPNGQVETQLFKGDVMPTTTGGAAIIFNDIEKLVQDTPTKNSKAVFEGCTMGLARKRIMQLEAAASPILSGSSETQSDPSLTPCLAKRLRKRKL